MNSNCLFSETDIMKLKSQNECIFSIIFSTSKLPKFGMLDKQEIPNFPVLTFPTFSSIHTDSCISPPTPLEKLLTLVSLEK